MYSFPSYNKKENLVKEYQGGNGFSTQSSGEHTELSISICVTDENLGNKFLPLCKQPIFNYEFVYEFSLYPWNSKFTP